MSFPYIFSVVEAFIVEVRLESIIESVMIEFSVLSESLISSSPNITSIHSQIPSQFAKTSAPQGHLSLSPRVQLARESLMLGVLMRFRFGEGDANGVGGVGTGLIGAASLRGMGSNYFFYIGGLYSLKIGLVGVATGLESGI